MKKVALCFIISYSHILNKEQIWKDWIEKNKDIIHVYFHYKNLNSIQSPWIKKHCIPEGQIASTTYFHVVPAYISLMTHAYYHDNSTEWFCFLTDSCVPIISPKKFRECFFKNYDKSIIKCTPAYWNVDFHKRSNLRFFTKDLHLANDPWFTFTRDHVKKTIHFLINNNDLYKKICNGGLANESLFAIILKISKELDTNNNNNNTVINESSNICDWSTMTTSTSPYVFKWGTKEEIQKIHSLLEKNKYSMFLRKVDKIFPDTILEKVIYTP